LLPREELKPKAPAGSGELISFDQSEFNKAAGAFGLGETGYVFVPTGCREGGCRLHIAFHGCKQSADYIDTKFVKDAGYNRWAESNRIVVLYPQAASHVPVAFADYFPFVEVIVNPLSCWDWWGYESDDYATKQGKQIKAVNLMVSRLTGQP
jgi:poly(3-hydroxybutyrate) depolymerase